MYGPPGNGKTISIKAIMKDAIDKGYSPLYVKSFKSNGYAPCRPYSPPTTNFGCQQAGQARRPPFP